MGRQGKFNPDRFNQVLHIEDLVSLIPGNIYWKNREGFYLGCNEIMAKILKFKSPQEIVGKTLYDLVEKKYADILHQIDEQVMTSGKIMEIEEMGPDEEGNIGIYLTRKTPLFDHDKNVIGLLGVSLNITDRKKMELELKQAKEEAEIQTKLSHTYLKNILVSLPESFYWMDRNGVILGCNDNQAKILGITNAKEIIGKDLYNLANMIGLDKTIIDQVRQNDMEVMQSKKTKRIEETITIGDEKRTFLSYKNPLLDDNGDSIGTFGVSVDITERKLMEEELLLAKEKAELANHAKSEFIMNMSHDLRTPFSGILGFAKILYNKETDLEKKEMLQLIVHSGEKLLILLNGILELTRNSGTNMLAFPVRFNIYESIDQIAGLLIAEIRYKNLEFRSHYAENIPLLVGDKSRFERVLLNLLSNAIKFTSTGYVEVRVNILNKTETDILLKIDIEDTGIGISEKHYEAIFEKFSRLHSSYGSQYQGSGLGLYMVQQFVKEMNGNIFVSSTLGKGTTFTCLLPFNLSNSAALEQNEIIENQLSPNSHAITKQKRILLIEDDLIAQKMQKIMLQDYFDCQVTAVNNGKEALEIIYHHHFDLVLTDVGLPDMDGFTLAKTIRELNNHNSQIPIVGLTAHIDEKIIYSQKNIYMTDLISKPFSEENCKKIISLI